MELKPAFGLEEFKEGGVTPDFVGVPMNVLAALYQELTQNCHCEPMGVDITLIGESPKKAGEVTYEFFVRDRSFENDTLDHYIIVIQGETVKVFQGQFKERKEG